MPRRWARGLVVVTAVVLMLTACGEHGAHAGKQAIEQSDAPPAGSVVAFYGDSLTSGLGASSPHRRWSSLLCERRGWTEVNPSIPGLGFVAGRGTLDLPSQIVAAEPDLVVVALGHNDLLLVDREGPAVETAVRDDLDRLRAGLPDARIVVLALFSPLALEPRQVATVNEWLRAAAHRIDAAFVPKSAQWLTDRPDWTVDGIHFSDAGNAAVADLVDAELKRLL